MKPKLPPGAIEASQATEGGYYWWLPVCSADNANQEEHWSIVSFHPADPNRAKSGWFIGPLLAPVERQLPPGHGLERVHGLTVRLDQLLAHATPEELPVLAEVYKRACIASQWFEMAAVFADYLKKHEKARLT